MSTRRFVLTLTTILGLTAFQPASSASEPTPPARPPVRPVTGSPAIAAGPGGVDAGVDWLIRHQHASGGWGQGEESVQMGGDAGDLDNVADTSMAVLALLRSGSTPVRGKHATAARRGVEYVLGEVERSPATGLAVTQVTGTRIQGKLGQHVDTFLAALLLTEVKGLMPADASNQRVEAALKKTLAKIQSQQRPDGTWSDDGWAPALTQGFASKALNRAKSAGLDVDEQVRERVEKNAQSRMAGGRVDVAGAAGVELYQAGSSLSGMQESELANRKMAPAMEAVIADAKASKDDKASARRELDRYTTNAKALAEAQDVVIAKMNDPSFAAGFGSNGGEEYLSHLSVGESLFQRGGQEWSRWIDPMRQNLGRVQNADGSWSGHHCITGRTTCTAAALMVLTIDRAAAPISGRLRG